VNNDLKSKNVDLIINYCDEAPVDRLRDEKEMDKSTEFFVDSIASAQSVGANIGVKYSGICDIPTMKKLNITKRW